MIDGRRFSNTLAFEEMGWRGVCVEPHPDYIDMVRRNRPGSVVIHAAASNHSSVRAPFHADPRGTLSGLSPRDEQELKGKYGESFGGFRIVHVPVKTLDEILADVNAPAEMELVSIDVEGTELEVLQGFDLKRWQPRVLIIDANDEQSGEQLRVHMERFGYQEARKTGANLLFTWIPGDTSAIRRARINRDRIHTRHPVDGSGPDELIKASPIAPWRHLGRIKKATRNVLTRLKRKPIRRAVDALRWTRAKFVSRPLIDPADLDGVRVFATSVIRGSSRADMTGFLFELDWAKGAVIRQIPISIDSSRPFWNARGGNRGGRGVFQHGDYLYVATAVSVLVYDRGLNQVAELNHPLLAGLHEIFVDDQGIWLTSTLHDLVIKLDFDGNVLDEWWGSESKLLQKQLGFSSRTLNPTLSFPEQTFGRDYEQYCRDERLHVNTVWKHGQDIYVLCCRRAAFVQIRPMERLIIHDRRLESPHNGITTPDGRVLINDTKNQLIRVYDLATGRSTKSLSTRIHSARGVSTQFARAGWQRGMWQATESVYLVGTSPTTLFEVDIDKNVIGRIVRIDEDVRHCIHGLTVTKGF